MQVVREENGKLMTVEADERQVFSGLALKIMKSLSESQKYPKEIARELHVHEQKVYYHIRQLEKKGFIRLARKEEIGGTLAKIYELPHPAFVVRFGAFREASRIPNDSRTMEPFVRNGEMNAKIIVGSPEPHGPERARSRDITFAIELAMFMGTFLTKTDHGAVIEDKDAGTSDLNNNLIIIGGPVTNRITKMVNEKLPVRFDKNKNILAGRKIYRRDECGFVARAPNPFNKDKTIMVIAGKRFSGTKAAVLAFMQLPGIMKKSFSIVEGLDNDGDGEIDSCKIIE